jgi:hypothetical protein
MIEGLLAGIMVYLGGIIYYLSKISDRLEK